MRKFESFIACEYVAAASGQRFDKRSPLDNRVIASIAEAGRAEVDAAVKAARGALHGEWGALTTEQRVELCMAWPTRSPAASTTSSRRRWPTPASPRM